MMENGRKKENCKVQLVKKSLNQARNVDLKTQNVSLNEFKSPTCMQHKSQVWSRKVKHRSISSFQPRKTSHTNFNLPIPPTPFPPFPTCFCVFFSKKKCSFLSCYAEHSSVHEDEKKKLREILQRWIAQAERRFLRAQLLYISGWRKKALRKKSGIGTII